MASATSEPDSLASVFGRFLRFGLLAWGGPVAQIGMIRHELVDRDRWITSEQFNRVLSVYQVLPGPEAHELCVYMGYQRRGRLGGLLAGLGFMLPGLVLMLVAAWAYVRYGIESALAAGLFAGFGPAALALVVRAVRRIGGHALHGRWLWLIAVVASLVQLLGGNFLVTLAAGGVAYVLSRYRLAQKVLAIALLAATVALATNGLRQAPVEAGTVTSVRQDEPPLTDIAVAGLRSGLLTFGGAYTVIPFLEHDAVREGGWLTTSQFVDGLAIGAALPAPLIIFATFVGYLAGDLPGALLMTFAIFLPAFSFTLVGHRLVERVVSEPRLHAFLDGVTAAVVGLIVVAAASLAASVITGVLSAALFVLALAVLWRWKSRAAIVAVMLGCGAAGIVAQLVAG